MSNALAKMTLAETPALRQYCRGMHKHAATCKKKLDDCASCKVAMQWFAALPLQVLSIVLEERQEGIGPVSRARTEEE